MLKDFLMSWEYKAQCYMLMSFVHIADNINISIISNELIGL